MKNVEFLCQNRIFLAHLQVSKLTAKNSFFLELLVFESFTEEEQLFNMIAKEYRLTEREVRKVLSRRKPFFSYMFVANVLENKLGHGRCGILLSGKVTKGSVNRNFFRRRFYDDSLVSLQKLPLDIVLVPKKGTTLDYKDTNQVAEFEKNIMFLFKTIKNNI